MQRKYKRARVSVAKCPEVLNTLKYAAQTIVLPVIRVRVFAQALKYTDTSLLKTCLRRHPFVFDTHTHTHTHTDLQRQGAALLDRQPGGAEERVLQAGSVVL